MKPNLYHQFVVVELAGAGGRKFWEAVPTPMSMMQNRFPNCVKIIAFDESGKPQEEWKNDPKNQAPVIGYKEDHQQAITRSDGHYTPRDMFVS